MRASEIPKEMLVDLFSDTVRGGEEEGYRESMDWAGEWHIMVLDWGVEDIMVMK